MNKVAAGSAGWPRRRISEIAQHSLGKMLDKAKNKGEPKPYLRNSNVRWFSFDLSDLLEMRFLPEESDRYTAVKGDLLICEGGYPGSPQSGIRTIQSISRRLFIVCGSTNRNIASGACTTSTRWTSPGR